MAKATKTPANRTINLIGQLMVQLRDAEVDELNEAMEEIQKFSDAWLVSGEGTDWPGQKDCCLADTDVVECLKEALEVKIDNAS
jgi:hypothetical protein